MENVTKVPKAIKIQLFVLLPKGIPTKDGKGYLSKDQRFSYVEVMDENDLEKKGEKLREIQ